MIKIRDADPVLCVAGAYHAVYGTSLSGIGYLSKESGQGFYLHPCIAVTPARCCLNCIALYMNERFHLGMGNISCFALGQDLCIKLCPSGRGFLNVKTRVGGGSFLLQHKITEAFRRSLH